MICNSITILAITWDVFTWSKQAHNIRFNYFYVHLFIIIMHHAFKIFDESLFKVSKKINPLSRISSFILLEKCRTLMKAFIESQFNYCPLIWMLHSRALNNKINRIHERALRTYILIIIHLSKNSLIKMAPLRFIKEMTKV